MPELPEIETLKLQLSPLILSSKIADIRVLKAKSFQGNAESLLGKEVESVKRYAKILVLELSGDFCLAIHLKMSGQLIYRKDKIDYREKNEYSIDFPNKHTRVIISFTNCSKLFFNDMRMFGWMKILRKRQNLRNTKDDIADLVSIIGKLGPDPTDGLTEKRFFEIIHKNKKPIKVVLMDQQVIAGVGNIYANEALFLSGIHPKTPNCDVSHMKSDLLLKKLVYVLSQGIKWGGASSNLFLNAFGEKGEAQNHLFVYQKEGEECLNACGSMIKKMKLGGRGTFFCPVCQRLSRG